MSKGKLSRGSRVSEKARRARYATRATLNAQRRLKRHQARVAADKERCANMATPRGTARAKRRVDEKISKILPVILRNSSVS